MHEREEYFYGLLLVFNAQTHGEQEKGMYWSGFFVFVFCLAWLSHFPKPYGGVVRTQTFSKVSLCVLRIQNSKEWQKREEIKVSLYVFRTQNGKEWQKWEEKEARMLSLLRRIKGDSKW